MRASTVVLVDFTVAGLLMILVTLLFHAASTNNYTMAWLTQVNEGETIYKEKCATCHVSNGSGPDLASPAVQEKTDVWLFRSISEGNSHLAVRKQLDDERVRKVIAYLRTFDREKRFPIS